MKAKLKDLKGKYYGTEIEIIFDNGYKEVLKLWDIGYHEPSIRELERNGLTQEEWDADSGLHYDITTDSHFESRETYKNALQLINKINK